MDDIIKIGNRQIISNFISRIYTKKPLFLCVIGNTDTAKIPGISAAGANPNITDYTPAADVEYLHYGECRCIDGVPITPEGIPTPGLITKAAIELTNIPFMVGVGGIHIIPQTPYIYFGGTPGENISNGYAVKNPEIIFKNAMIFGKNLSKMVDYLVIGESIAGGTTTALGVLLSMGYDAKDRISSSLSINPIKKKLKAIDAGMNKSKVCIGDFKDHPFKAIEYFGDPMQPAHAGIIIGAATSIPVILAGGTQMSAILAIINAINPQVLKNIAIGTTSWIIKDKNTDLKGIVEQINPDIPILAANFNFSNMKPQGLQSYEKGVVKEGVGAGGITIASILSSKGKITIEKIQKKLEKDYEALNELYALSFWYG